MVRSVIKYALWIICIFGVFKVTEFYSAYKIISYAQECDLQKNMCELKLRKPTSDEVILAMNENYKCIADKQSWVEAQVLGIPKEFSRLENNDAFRKDYDQRLEKFKC